MVDYRLDTDGDEIFDYNDLDSDDDGCWDVVEAGYLSEDFDGIYGPEPPPNSNLPNVTNGTVDSRGRIVNDDYDYNDEPNSYVNDVGSKIFLFQEQSTAPVIDVEPVSSIACYIGSPAEFEVTAQSNQKINYYWQLSTDNGSSWSDLELSLIHISEPTRPY